MCLIICLKNFNGFAHVLLQKKIEKYKTFSFLILKSPHVFYTSFQLAGGWYGLFPYYFPSILPLCAKTWHRYAKNWRHPRRHNCSFRPPPPPPLWKNNYLRQPLPNQKTFTNSNHPTRSNLDPRTYFQLSKNAKFTLSFVSWSMFWLFMFGSLQLFKEHSTAKCVW